MKALIFIAILLVSGRALADQCILSDPAWVTPYQVPPSSISSIGYQVLNGYMASIYPGNIERAFEGVPRGIAQQLSQFTNPTTFFNTNVAPVYHEAILTSWANGPCPLLTETGSWILSH